MRGVRLGKYEPWRVSERGEDGRWGMNERGEHMGAGRPWRMD